MRADVRTVASHGSSLPVTGRCSLTTREGEGYTYWDFFSTRPPEAVSKEKIEGLVILTPAKDTLRNKRIDCGTDKNPPMFSAPFAVRIARREDEDILLGGEHE